MKFNERKTHKLVSLMSDQLADPNYWSNKRTVKRAAKLAINGADPYAVDKDGFSIMDNLLAFEHFGLALKVIKKHSDLSFKGRKGESLLMQVIECHNITNASSSIAKEFDLLLEYLINNPDNLNDRDRRGDSPAVYSIMHGTPDILRKLLEKGVDANEVNSGLSLIHLAASQGMSKCIQLLMDFGADISTPCKGYLEYTPIMYAAASGDPNTIKVVADLGGNPLEKSNGKDLLSICEDSDHSGHEVEAYDLIKSLLEGALVDDYRLQIKDDLTSKDFK
ncbi:MAG: ankyrin repeat domain-containing protein [Methyloprofundus sp.]|nr:ankyrin repeat domain-containing protein [Methyloprofundus sp.]